MFKRILFAHNATSAAERALFYVEHLARAENAEVVVMHVYELPERYTTQSGYETLVDQLESIAQEVVQDAVEHLQEMGIQARGMTLAGDPAAAILDAARQEEISIIVMGTRGPSSVKDLLLGNVSMEVLRFAHCPVLMVP